MLKLTNSIRRPFCNQLKAIGPLDGRYQGQVKQLSDYFSEFALIKYRTKVEINWVKYLLENNMVQQDQTAFQLSPLDITYLDTLHEQFNMEGALRVKEIERTTNHDVKAVEYYIKEKLNEKEQFRGIQEYVHFCCTSEDINNMAYSLMMKDAKQHLLLPLQKELMTRIEELSIEQANRSMISRTHGQYASPTTLGKEMANFHYRLQEQYSQLSELSFKAKLNGAVGNFNAHEFVYPEYNWPQLSQNFIEQQGLQFNPYTTQIESHDSVAQFYNTLGLFNTITLGMSRDIWHYISLGYFKMKVKKQEVGSSTMPHKVNPIDFENAEGNLGLANSFCQHFAQKLPISRYQRDLSDSTVMRNHGLAFGYSQLAYKSMNKGLDKLQVNGGLLDEELNNHWEVLAEPIQMMMRKYNVENAYEKLKEVTRGQKVTKELLHELVKELEIPEEDKRRMLELTPQSYLGNAAQMASVRREK